MSRRKSIYKVSFINQGKVYEVFAQKVYQADLYGFVVIEQLIFGERSTVVVDPGEERLKSEFESVRRSFVPMHAIIRIDEVEKEGVAKIHELGANVTAFPPTLPPPGGRRDG
ncbi:Domain of unknown function DUF1820 [Thioalkalivibrio sulfidiphilus HL-EbGr7]|uniref:DUF1820 domain-containing protein n=1 Tax=Thioalkalivibrio sulfidiphilus (strain HL-EbGR7) TaxID=396588 RepID=B8GPJ2_THISH|nr:DUF1820 family protein [Thioalkalivibrio sulfidiphilus]ACL72159.1 Domain of unknown function DUF1820 [Thioalkalivibrio sulfidiphilus HL-EbGr7]